MKIALNMRQDDNTSPEVEREKAIERDVEAYRRNDWEAKTRLVQAFMPLLASLAKKRSQDAARMNRYIEAGKEGLATAVKHYKSQSTNGKFQVYALNYIENQMNRVEKPGFFSRLLNWK